MTYPKNLYVDFLMKNFEYHNDVFAVTVARDRELYSVPIINSFH